MALPSYYGDERDDSIVVEQPQPSVVTDGSEIKVPDWLLPYAGGKFWWSFASSKCCTLDNDTGKIMWIQDTYIEPSGIFNKNNIPSMITSIELYDVLNWLKDKTIPPQVCHRV